MYRMPFLAKRSPSFMNAAFTASGVVVTVGHARQSTVPVSALGRSSIIGKKMMSSGLFWCFL